MSLANNLFLALVIYHQLLLKVDSKCQQSFQCGHLGSLEFPFTQDPVCGLFLVEDCDSGSPMIHLSSDQWSWYNVRNTSTNKLVLSDDFRQYGLMEKSCLSLQKLPLPQSPYVSFTFSPNLTLFHCFKQTSDKEIQDHFQNYQKEDCPAPAPIHSYTVYYRNPTTDDPATNGSSIPTGCLVIQLPKKPDQDKGDLFDLLTAQFTLEWNVSEACYQCHHGGGQCLSDSMNKFYCKKGNIGKPDDLCLFC